MANELGFFGGGTFGRGFFGWASTALPFCGTVASAQLIADLSQGRPNSQLIAATVAIDGTDYSSFIESIIIRTADSVSTGSADLVVIGDVSAAVSIGDAVSVSFSYTFANGSTYTKKVFDGIVKTIVPTKGSQTESTQISVWDEAESLLSQAPHNTTWTGTAKALVEDELTELGIETLSVDFDDYSMAAVDLTQFQTVRDLIMAVVNGQDECGIFTQSSGRVCVWSFESQRDSSGEPVYSFPRTGITYLQQIDASSYRYRNYVVTGLTGTTATATGTGTVDGGESSLFLTSEADLQPRADAVVDKQERNRIVFQSSLHPLVRVGDLVEVEQTVGVYVEARVIGVTHVVEWSGQNSPGCWTTIIAEVV